MNLLLDSHAVLWSLHDPHRLTPEAAAAIRDPARTVFFSAASVWEMELKAAAGRLYLPEDWVARAEGTGFLKLPITAADTRSSARLPRHHTDPFDRLLVAQAIAHRLTIVTRDRFIPRYDVAVVAA